MSDDTGRQEPDPNNLVEQPPSSTTIANEEQALLDQFPVKSVEELTALFRSRGLKVTPQRQVIFRVLGSSTHHPTAEAVYAAVRSELPTISLRTVYQSLNDLSAMGQLSALDLGTGSTRFDPTLEPHHHLVCGACGAIEDLHHDFPGVVLAPPAAEGFEVNATQIVFRGLCSSCAAHDDAAAAPSPGTKPSEL